MTYIRNRILRLIPVFFLVTFASFALLNILPGDVADAMLGGADADDTSEDTRNFGTFSIIANSRAYNRYACGYLLCAESG